MSEAGKIKIRLLGDAPRTWPEVFAMQDPQRRIVAAARLGTFQIYVSMVDGNLGRRDAETLIRDHLRICKAALERETGQK
jgi:hypothetical protein